MKTEFITFLFILSGLSCLGQDSVLVKESLNSTEAHLIFKGMPMNGNINDFVDLFMNDGFTLSSSNIKGSVALSGIFAGQDASILVSGTPMTNTVFQICVMFEGTDSYWSAKSKFNELATSYMKKYGVPTKTKRSFDSPYYEGDGYEDTAMRLGKVNYICFWNLAEGSIVMTISNSGATIIMYKDGINEKLDKKERQESVSYDI